MNHKYEQNQKNITKNRQKNEFWFYNEENFVTVNRRRKRGDELVHI